MIMKRPRTRQAVLIAGGLSAVIMLGLLAVIGGTVAVTRAGQADDLKQANDVATTFMAELEQFRRETVTSLGDGYTDPGKVKAAASSAIESMPKLPTAPQYGVDNSTIYFEARAARQNLGAALQDVVAAAEEVGPQLTYLTRAETLVDFETPNLPPQRDGSRLRNETVEPLSRRTDSFAALGAPNDLGPVKTTVVRQMRSIIAKYRDAATSLDQGRGVEVEFSDAYVEAMTAIRTAERAAHVALESAIQVVADTTVGSSPSGGAPSASTV